MEPVSDTPPRPRGDVAKLPAWAREYVDHLARYAAEAARRLDEVQHGDAGNTYVHDYVHGDFGLGDGAHVRFRMPEDVNGPHYVEVYLDDGEVRIRSDTGIRSDTHLAVVPVSSNVITVRWEAR